MFNSTSLPTLLPQVNTCWPPNIPNDYGSQYFYQWYPYYITREPDKCYEKVHVFPCKHCRKCECGKLELPRK